MGSKTRLDLRALLGYAIPSMPRTIFAGGLSTDEAKPLPSDIEGVISEAGRDVILVSFGSMIIFLPDRIINTLTEVFVRLEYTIIWRWKGNMPIKVPRHVHIRK